MIAFIGAMDEEIKEFLGVMDTYKEIEKSGIPFYEGTLSGYPCVLMKSGVGKIMAAMSVSVLLENFDVEGLVNIGTAGGLKDYLHVLDIIIGDRVCNYDADVLGWEKSFDNTRISFKCDENYVNIAKEVIDEDRVFIGDIASGDSFISSKEKIDYILKYYPTSLCAEMEAAAVGQVATFYKKPFVIIRSLSDITLHDNNNITFEEYVFKASKRSALMCKKFIEKLKSR